MRITFDGSGYMGYIYLSPHYGFAMSGADALQPEDLEKVRQLGQLPVAHVQRLQQPADTYNEALSSGRLIEWYMNDKDEEGNIMGIELDMIEAQMDKLTQDVAIGSVHWNGTNYDVLLLDELDHAFSPANFLYAMTEQRDTYVVLRMVSDLHFDVTAVLSARPDLYPVSYWSLPLFVKYE